MRSKGPTTIRNMWSDCDFLKLFRLIEEGKRERGTEILLACEARCSTPADFGVGSVGDWLTGDALSVIVLVVCLYQS